MKIFSLFARTSAVELKTFATSLTDDLVKRYPPELDNKPGKQVSVTRLTRIIEDMCQRVVEFQASHKLGWIGKSRLANNVQWELKDRGYTKKFIDFATEAVVVHLNKP